MGLPKMNVFIKCLVRFRFLITSKKKTSDRIRSILQEYRDIGELMTKEQGEECTQVPKMRGVDEDMRAWSFYMILEHNVIVNRTMSMIVESLARNEEPKNLPVKDPKKDVMPSGSPGPEQLKAFCQSVEDHLKLVSGLSGLRGTFKTPHPIFGMLNAHGWHCMFCLHLELHLSQAKRVLDWVRGR